MRCSVLRFSLCAGLVLPVVSGAAFAAGSSIDPDPRAPSLSELLQREEDAKARRAANRIEEVIPPAPSVTPVVPQAKATIPAPPNASKSVRQIYPSPYGQSAVTVLVPGGGQPGR